MRTASEIRAAKYAYQKVWRQKNAAKLAVKRKAKYALEREQECERQRAYYAANGERIREQVRARQNGRRDEVRAYQREWIRKDRARNRLYYLWDSARRRATRRGLEFALSLDDLSIPLHCPVLGIPIILQAGRPPLAGAPSLDRVDNSRGYTSDNVRVISFRANAIKRDMTLAEARLLVQNWEAR